MLVAAFSAISAATGEQLRAQLDELASLTPHDLAELGEVPTDAAELAARQRSFFPDTPHRGGDTFNRGRAAIVIVRRQPTAVAVETLAAALGSELRRLLIDEDDSGRGLDPDEALRRAALAPEETPTPALPALPARSRVAVAAIVGGLVLLAAGLYRSLGGAGGADSPIVDTAVESPVRTLVTGVPASATSTFLMGQRRVLRMTSGRLLALYPTPAGLQILVDENNQGRSWRSPTTIPDIDAVSVAGALDGRDRIHLAFSDGTRTAYARIVADPQRGWSVTKTVEVDRATGSPVVDVAWDGRAGVAHVVWVQQLQESEQPMWAAISGVGDAAAVKQTALLAEAAAGSPVLVNVAVGARSQVIATYRKPGAPRGWFSRTAAPPAGARPGSDKVRFSWAPEQTVPIDSEIGAASLAVDARGTAHLVLRDDSATALVYANKTAGAGWTQGEPALDAEHPEQIDSPSVAIDSVSRLVYVFFQTAGAGGRPEIALVIRDPATGWEGPYSIAAPEDIPDGALFPTALAGSDGQAIVLWTTGGSTPALQAARVTAP
ncbi:MAG: hypothetical protein ABR575_07560 [Actinomycetota bacterium]